MREVGRRQLCRPVCYALPLRQFLPLRSRAHSPQIRSKLRFLVPERSVSHFKAKETLKNVEAAADMVNSRGGVLGGKRLRLAV